MRRPVCFALAISLAWFVAVSHAAFDSAKGRDEKALKITRITPTGEDMPAAHQIVIQFNRPVVPLGRMDRTDDEIPIKIDPPLKCQWRWLNTDSLACQLGEKDAMRGATRYKMTVDPGITAEDGTTIPEQVIHEFITERPQVRNARFQTWRSPGMPAIRVIFNQPVGKTSVEECMHFLQDGSGMRLLPNAEPDQYDNEKPRFVPLLGVKHILDFGNQEKQKSDDQLSEAEGDEARRIWLISPREELTSDTTYSLQVIPGLVSAIGPEKGVTRREIVRFDTFPEFRFEGVKCYDNNNKELAIAPNDPQKESKRCNPLETVAVAFSSPVINTEVKTHMGFLPDLAGGRTDYDPWANHGTYSRLNRPHKRSIHYSVQLPEFLKADQEYRIRSSGELADEFGRKLPRPLDMTFYTDRRKPEYKLLNNTSVLEKQVDSKVPIAVTNLTQLRRDYRRLTTSGAEDGLSLATDVPQVKDIAFLMPFGVREMLGGKSGVLYGNIMTTPPVPKSHWEDQFFAQVTPFAVHVKIAHFNTLVWVTDLSDGKPVAGAKVDIYTDSYSLSGTQTILSGSVTDDMGIAVLDGLEKIDPDHIVWEEGSWRNDYIGERLFVRVVKAEDMALVPLDYWFNIDTWRVSKYAVYSDMKKRHGHIRTWGTTAQGVYRAGDTVQYKFWVRNQDNNAFTEPPKDGYTLEIYDPTGKAVHTVKDVKLSEFGAFDGEYAVPETGAVGWYRFHLTANFTDYEWDPMQVLVSDFTPSPFKVSADVNGDMFRPDDEVEVSTSAKMHSGGPYADAETRVVATLKPRLFKSKHQAVKGFTFDSVRENSGWVRIFEKTDRVDDKGEMTVKFTVPDQNVVHGQISFESAVQDDRGKYVAATAVADYMGRDRFVGLKLTSWVFNEDEPAEIEYAVVNEKGEPVWGTKIDMVIKRREIRVARVKGAGNAYLTNITEEWVNVAKIENVSGPGPGKCVFTPEKPGSYRITATISDTKGRGHQTQLWAWVIGKGEVLWDQGDDNSLEIVPEQESYNVGDTARYLVKNPFPGVTALITVERFGVMKQWTQTMDSGTPVIEFPVEPDFVPGFFLSIVVTSPRADKPEPMNPGDPDLGKPTFRMGYVAVQVKDPYKEIVVDVKPEHDLYRPGDMVNVSLQATPRHAGKTEPIELAVAVLDEAVFDLILGGRNYYDPYAGFYSLDNLDLRNFNLLTRLVGLQKFEKKGANSGGDGGIDISMRSVFKFVSYWNPALETDAEGRANIEFKLPDNLTGWRVFAMAMTPTDRMGLGDNGFKVNRPTEVRPVMPNQVTEGDQFNAGFSVMNRTEKPRELSVSITAEGALEDGKATHSEKLQIGPYKKVRVWMPVQTKGPGEVRFSCVAKDETDGDGLRHTVPVKKRRSLETAATYGTTVSDRVEESIAFPEKMHGDVGSLSVTAAPSVIGNVEGAFKYMHDYPYICWEQQLSKGTMAAHYLNLKDYMPDSFVWENCETIPVSTLRMAANFQAPNGGMCYFIPETRYVSPYLSAYTALAFNWLRSGGYEIPGSVEDKLHSYLEDFLRNNVYPDFYTKGMASTVRAVALAALAPHGKITPDDLSRYRPHVPFMSLFGKAHFLMAAMECENRFSRDKGEMIRETANAILGHASQTGGKFMFNEELDDSYVRILATPIRANAAILSAFVEMGEKPEYEKLVGDVPFKLVRAITQTRGNRDHWENTQENMFCMNALIDYSRVYESEKPDMVVRVLEDANLLGETRFQDLRDDQAIFERPITESDPGRKTKVAIERNGAGRLYYAARVRFAPLEEHAIRINSGIDIRREVSVERDGKWVLLETPGEIKRGELVRVDIFLSLPTARNFVVVDDPVPGGLEPVNRDLATASTVDADKGAFQVAGGSWFFQFTDWVSYNVSRWSFYHKELRHDAARFYSDYLPPGNYHLSYTAQAVASGEFVHMPVHSEEMYDPDVFGKGLPAVLRVTDKEE